MLVRTVLICLVLASLSECMFRPQPRHYHNEECSCEEEEVPCEEEPTRPPTTTTAKPTTVPVTTPTTTRTTPTTATTTTTPTTTTTIPKTTTRRRCANIRAPVSPFLRKNGYWCSMIFTFGANSTMSYDYEDALTDCSINGLVVSSLETDEEKAAYIKHIQETVLYDLTAIWVGASVNKTDNIYYWDDKLAVGAVNPQPTIVDPNGHVAWFINLNSSVPGYGDYRVVAKSGNGNPKVNALLCGAPGLQF